MRHNLLLYVFSIFLKYFVVSNFNIFAATLTQVKRFRITSSRRPHIGGRSCLVPISQCALPEKHFLPQHKLFFRRCRRAARARPLTCSDAAAYTKETVIAPRDTTTNSRMEKQWCCMACLEINSGKCCAKCCCCSRGRREADGQREERA